MCSQVGNRCSKSFKLGVFKLSVWWGKEDSNATREPITFDQMTSCPGNKILSLSSNNVGCKSGFQIWLF